MKFLKVRQASDAELDILINPTMIVSISVAEQTGKCGTDYWVQAFTVSKQDIINIGPFPTKKAASIKAESFAQEVEKAIKK